MTKPAAREWKLNFDHSSELWEATVFPSKSKFEKESVWVVEKEAYAELQAKLDAHEKHLELFEESIRHSFKEREDRLKKKSSLAVEALRFYASMFREPTPELLNDFGDKAKEALEAIHKMTEGV